MAVCDMAGKNTDEVEGSTSNDSKVNNNAVIEVAPEFHIKHPLQHTWTLWFFENTKGRTWEDNQREITSFDTVEDFWSLYNHIRVPSDLRQGCDYSLFKKGIRPMWEDDVNKAGGRWLISLEKRQRSFDLDRFWLDIMLLMIGENFDYSDNICGAVVNIRPKLDKIGIWTADATKSTENLEIGRKVKDQLQLTNVSISYQNHRDTMVKSGSTTKHMYTV